MKQLLFNPFQRFSEVQLIVFGLIITAFGTWASAYFNLRYDGALDVHFSTKNPWIISLFDNIINISCLFLFLFLAGKIINKKTRLIDVLATILVARTPLYFIPFFNYDNSMSVDMSDKTIAEMQAFAFSNITLIIISGIFGLFALIWYVALLFNGYKTASNGKGSKSVYYFIGALLLAEIVSKVLIIFLNK
jgi:hypothetical protein